MTMLRQRYLVVSSTLLAAVLLSGCGGGKTSSPPKPLPDGAGRRFLFAVQSNPPGAEIWLDGQSTSFRTMMLDVPPIGITPPPADGQPHRLTLRFPGYHDWNQWVEWTEDASIIVKAQLTPSSEAEGILSITSTPQGAKVWLNGTDTGKVTPVTLTVPPTRHALRLTLDGHLPAFESVDVPAGSIAEVHVPLTPQDKGIVTGVVFDRFGNAPVGVTAQLRDGQGQVIATTSTTAFGSFHFASVLPGEYTITAEAMIEGQREVGRLDNVKVQPSQRTIAYLVLFLADLVGNVEGTVRTPDGRPVANAQVALLYYAVASPVDFVLTSRRTVTDGQGRFRFESVPAAPHVLVVRKNGFQVAQTQAVTRQGETTQVTVTLTPLGADNPPVSPPTKVFAIAQTLPTKALPIEDKGRGMGDRKTTKARQITDAHAFYRHVLLNTLRRHRHPATPFLLHAPRSTLHAPPSRFFPIGFMAHVEVGWEPPLKNPSQGLLGYRIYRSNPQASGWQFRLFVDEPEQTVVADTAFDATSGQTYRYAVTAVKLDGQETEKSEPAETTVLPPLRLLSPVDNAQVTQSQLTFRWQPINGQVPFYVVEMFLDPTQMLVSDPEWDSSILSGTTEFTYDGKPLLKGKTYWWLVIGLDNRDWLEANAFTVSEVHRVVIVGD